MSIESVVKGSYCPNCDKEVVPNRLELTFYKSDSVKYCSGCGSIVESDLIRKLYADIKMLDQRISDALNVIDWAGELGQEYLMKKIMAVGGILSGAMTSADLRKEGFDLDKFKIERQQMVEAIDTLTVRHAEVLKELETIRERRNDAVRLVEEKRLRIQELEKQLKG